MVELDNYKDLLMDVPTFGNLAFTRKNGKPHVSPVWFEVTEEDFQNETISINTVKGRVKAKNLIEGANVALSNLDPANGYRYLGIEGEVISTVAGEIGDKHIDILAKKYLNADTYPYKKDSEIRIKILIKIKNIHGN